MRLGLNGATTMRADLFEDIRVAGAAGFELVELWAEKLDRAIERRGLGAVAAALEEAGVRPWAINSIEHVTFRNPAEEGAIRDRCRHLADVARELGCSNIVVVPGFAPPGTPWSTVVQESCRVLSDLADIAGEDVRLAFEFIGGQGLSVATLGQAREVVETCGRANVGLVIDTFHYHAGGSREGDFDGLAPERVFVFHINDAEPLPREELRDCHRLLPGEGALPLSEVLGEIRRIGYRDMASLEVFRPAYWERDPLELARAGREAMARVLSEAGLM